VTPHVEYEVVEHPMQIKRFEWGALRAGQIIDEDIVRRVEDDLVKISDLNKKTEEVMNLANSCLTKDGKPIHIIERGESESIALSLLLAEKGIESVVVIDERTARMLCENVGNLEKIMENKLHMAVDVDMKKVKMFQKVKVIRSTELMFMAYKKGLINRDRKFIEAILYALKFGGCSISEKEIEVMKRA
jgi:predicted nucleic acid-binding protein